MHTGVSGMTASIRFPRISETPYTIIVNFLTSVSMGRISFFMTWRIRKYRNTVQPCIISRRETSFKDVSKFTRRMNQIKKQCYPTSWDFCLITRSTRRSMVMSTAKI